MKRPKVKGLPPEKETEGGRAAERLRQFEQERGVAETPPDKKSPKPKTKLKSN
jgi:hypothetical protein